MEFRKVEQVRDEVVGILPVYSEVGNVTEVMLRSGECVWEKRRVASTVNALVKAYAIDLPAQRKQILMVLGRKGAPFPFYLPHGRVFVPLKMRKTRTESDSAYGYLEVGCLGEIQANSGHECWLTLTNGTSMTICSSRNTILSAQRDGLEILEHLGQEDKGEQMDEQVQGAIQILVHSLAALARQLDRIEKHLEE